MSTEMKEIPCGVCHEVTDIKMTTSQHASFTAMLEEFNERIKMIFPSLTLDEIELIVTGMHPACWEDMSQDVNK